MYINYLENWIMHAKRMIYYNNIQGWLLCKNLNPPSIPSTGNWEIVDQGYRPGYNSGCKLDRYRYEAQGKRFSRYWHVRYWHTCTSNTAWTVVQSPNRRGCKKGWYVMSENLNIVQLHSFLLNYIGIHYVCLINKGH